MAQRASINGMRGGKKIKSKQSKNCPVTCLGTHQAGPAKWNGGRETPLGKGTLLSALFVVSPVNLHTVLSVSTVPCLGDRGSGFKSWICFELAM